MPRMPIDSAHADAKRQALPGRLVPTGFLFAALLATSARAQEVTHYPVPTPLARPWGIVAGTDGALWFSERGACQYGRIDTLGAATEFDGITCSPFCIARGNDGDLWFPLWDGEQIARRDAAGNVTFFTVPSGYRPYHAVLGPDNALWFTTGGVHAIGRLEPTTGAVTLFPLSAGRYPLDIVAGPDGNLWFTEFGADRIGKITLGGGVTEFPTLSANSDPVGITVGPDGNLWFGMEGSGRVGRVTPAGQMLAEFGIGGGPSFLTTGPDGNIWYTDSFGYPDLVVRLKPNGDLLPFEIGGNSVGPRHITTGADGNIWFAESEANAIGRIVTPCLPWITGQSGDDAICEGQSLSLGVNAEDATSYEWTKDGAPWGTNQPWVGIPSATLADAGTYRCRATNACGFVDSAPMTVAVKSRPSAVASGSAEICVGSSTPLSGSGGTSCSWSPWSGLSSSSSCSPMASPTSTTTYSLAVWTDGCPSANTAQVTVTVHPRPVAAASGSTTICEGQSTFLSGSGGTTCSWSPTSFLSNPASCSPTATPTTTTTWSLTVTDAFGCVSSNPASATVTVSPLPPAVGNSLRLARVKVSLQWKLGLTWTNVAGANAYTVYSDTSPGGTFATVVSGAASGTTGATVTIPSTPLVYYKVAARNDCGYGPK